MRFGELFAGVGGFGIGLERAGMEVVWQVEIDPWANQVLERHWPQVQRWTDIRAVDGSELPHVDLIAFGSPCQDLSVAGRRAGMAGERSGLFFEAARIIRAVAPEFALWENVPGLLNSNRGRDFAVVLQSLADAGALDICWRVLDAQFFGVPQRRRRVFLVADFGGHRAESILFASEGGTGDSAPSRAEGADIAYCLNAGSRGSGGGGRQPWNTTYVVNALNANSGGNQSALTIDPTNGVADAAQKGYGGWGVRRLTPRLCECERLMGWTDDWTRWTADGREIPDTHRYRLIGNGVVSNVVEWLGWRVKRALGQ